MRRRTHGCIPLFTHKSLGKLVEIAHQSSRRRSAKWFVVGFTAFALIGMPSAVAKTFGGQSCFGHVCWQVPSRALLSARIGEHFVAKASWYDISERDRHNRPGLTSSGEKFDPNALDRVSSPNLPNGTTVLLWSPDSKIAAYAIVNNTGPFIGRRVFDLPIGLARSMGFVEKGVTQLHVVIVELPSPEDVRYRANRKYHFRGGILGSFETMYDAIGALPTPIIARFPKDSDPKPLNFGRVAMMAKKHRTTRPNPSDTKARQASRLTKTRWQRTIFEE